MSGAEGSSQAFRAHQESIGCRECSKTIESNSRKENAMMPILDGSLHKSGYGATELRQYYQRFMSRSLILSNVLQIACVTAYFVFRAPEDRTELPRIVEVIPYRSLISPSLFQSNNPSLISTGTKSFVSWKYSIPISVPVPFVDSSNAIPSPRLTRENSGICGIGSVFANNQVRLSSCWGKK